MASKGAISKVRDRLPAERRAELISWLHGSQLDNAVDYIRRGRKHTGLSTEALFAAWEAKFRGMADDPFSTELLAEETDLAAEIELRGLAPPYERVEEPMSRFIAALDAQFELMKLNAPELYAGANQGLAREIAEFKAKKLRSNN